MWLRLTDLSRTQSGTFGICSAKMEEIRRNESKHLPTMTIRDEAKMSPHHTLACGHIRGRVTDGADSSAVTGWSDRAKVMALQLLPAGCGCVDKPGWVWPLRMAKRVSERATRGGEGRNTAVSGHRIRGGHLERFSGSVWARWARLPGVRERHALCARRETTEVKTRKS